MPETKDILDELARCSRAIEKRYQEAQKTTQNHRVTMILDHLIDRQRKLSNEIEEFKREAKKETLNFWFKYVPERDKWTLPEVTFHDNMDTEEITDIAVQHVNVLVVLYDDLSRNAWDPHVTDIFERLHVQAKNERNHLVQGIISMTDQ